MNDEHITIVYKRGDLDGDELDTEFARMWREIATDEELRATMTAAGFDPDDVLSSYPDVPISVSSTTAKFEPVTITLVVVGVVAKDVWQKILLPRLVDRYGPGGLGPERKPGDE